MMNAVDLAEARRLLGVPADADPEQVRALLAARSARGADGEDDRLLDAAARIVEDDLDATGPPRAPRPPDWPTSRPPRPARLRQPRVSMVPGLRRPPLPRPVSSGPVTPGAARAGHRTKPPWRPWLPPTPTVVACWLAALLIMVLSIGCAVALNGVRWLAAYAAVAALGGWFTGAIVLRSRRGAAAALVPALWCGVFLGLVLGPAVLAVRGVTAPAVIVGESHYPYKSLMDYRFTAVVPDGELVPGGDYDVSVQRSDPPPFRVGDTVVLQYDPAGLVPPDTPGEDGWRFIALTAVVLVIGALWACALWWGWRTAVRPARRA
jgi:hypothetical protein